LRGSALVSEKTQPRPKCEILVITIEMVVVKEDLNNSMEVRRLKEEGNKKPDRRENNNKEREGKRGRIWERRTH